MGLEIELDTQGNIKQGPFSSMNIALYSIKKLHMGNYVRTKLLAVPVTRAFLSPTWTEYVSSRQETYKTGRILDVRYISG